jgi:hypothetical protein
VSGFISSALLSFFLVISSNIISLDKSIFSFFKREKGISSILLSGVPEVFLSKNSFVSKNSIFSLMLLLLFFSFFLFIFEFLIIFFSYGIL